MKRAHSMRMRERKRAMCRCQFTGTGPSMVASLRSSSAASSWSLLPTTSIYSSSFFRFYVLNIYFIYVLTVIGDSDGLVSALDMVVAVLAQGLLFARLHS